MFSCSHYKDASYLFHDGGPYHIETIHWFALQSMDWFLHNRDLRHERVNPIQYRGR